MSTSAWRFEAAVIALISEGPIKLRLTLAYSDHLEELQDEELPADLREAFSNLHAALHRVAPTGTETCIKASVQKMSPAEAASHAETILRIYANLLGHAPAAEHVEVADASNTSAPWYLVSGS